MRYGQKSLYYEIQTEEFKKELEKFSKPSIDEQFKTPNSEAPSFLKFRLIQLPFDTKWDCSGTECTRVIDSLTDRACCPDAYALYRFDFDSSLVPWIEQGHAQQYSARKPAIELPLHPRSGDIPCGVSNPDSHRLKASPSKTAKGFHGKPLRATSRMVVQRPIDPAYLPMGADGSPWSNLAQLANIQAGDTIVLCARGGNGTLVFADGSNNTVKNISVYYSGSIAVDMKASPNALVDQVQVIPRPGSDRLISSNADGISAVQLGANLTIQRSRILRTCDDGMSPNSQQLALFAGQTGANTVTVNRSAYSTFANGLQVQFIDNKTGFPAVTARILSQDPPYSTALPAFGSSVTLTLDQTVPTLAVNDAMVYADPAFRGAGLMVRNNLVQDGVFARGMSLWGLLGGVVQGNMIRNTAWASAIDILESSSTDTWLNGPVANMTVRNNAIEGFSGAYGTDVQNGLAAIEIVATSATGPQVPGSPLQNLTVVNNFISSGPYSGISIGNVNGGTVTGNLLMNVANDPALNGPNPAYAAQVKQPLATQNNIGVTTAPNTIDATTPVAYLVSSISFSQQAVAPNSWAAVLGANLAPKTDVAAVNPLPASLDGVTVTILDSSGASTDAPVQFISGQQINFLVPANVAQGAAVVTVTSNGAATGRGAILIDSLAPALFSADGSGTGLALGTQVLTHADGSQVNGSLGQPVNLGAAGDVATLVLYATGIRSAAMGDVSIVLGGVRLPVLYSGSQGSFAGLDQIDVTVPPQLRGAGKVSLRANVSGLMSNSVTVTID